MVGMHITDACLIERLLLPALWCYRVCVLIWVTRVIKPRLCMPDPLWPLDQILNTQNKTTLIFFCAHPHFWLVMTQCSSRFLQFLRRIRLLRKSSIMGQCFKQTVVYLPFSSHILQLFLNLAWLSPPSWWVWNAFCGRLARRHPNHTSACKVAHTERRKLPTHHSSQAQHPHLCKHQSICQGLAWSRRPLNSKWRHRLLMGQSQ